ncbi:hypothetical protein DFH09DRAFT_1077364 [Mycena vulgaris]|nr:hypothetical protein DFH09DRAFT_1077364 [Mycena vulgaris]
MIAGGEYAWKEKVEVEARAMEEGWMDEYEYEERKVEQGKVPTPTSRLELPTAIRSSLVPLLKNKHASGPKSIGRMQGVPAPALPILVTIVLALGFHAQPAVQALDARAHRSGIGWSLPYGNIDLGPRLRSQPRSIAIEAQSPDRRRAGEAGPPDADKGDQTPSRCCCAGYSRKVEEGRGKPHLRIAHAQIERLDVFFQPAHELLDVLRWRLENPIEPGFHTQGGKVKVLEIYHQLVCLMYMLNYLVILPSLTSFKMAAVLVWSHLPNAGCRFEVLKLKGNMISRRGEGDENRKGNGT